MSTEEDVTPPPSPCHPGSIVRPVTSQPNGNGKPWFCSACLAPFDETPKDDEVTPNA